MSIHSIRKLLSDDRLTLDSVRRQYEDDDKWCVIDFVNWSRPMSDPMVEVVFSRR